MSRTNRPERSAVENTIIKRLVQFLPALAIAVFILSDAKPVSAGCFVKLKDCYAKAANQTDWLDLWLNGMDCELDFTDCVRRAIIGR